MVSCPTISLQPADTGRLHGANAPCRPGLAASWCCGQPSTATHDDWPPGQSACPRHDIPTSALHAALAGHRRAPGAARAPCHLLRPAAALRSAAERHLCSSRGIHAGHRHRRQQRDAGGGEKEEEEEEEGEEEETLSLSACAGDLPPSAAGVQQPAGVAGHHTKTSLFRGVAWRKDSRLYESCIFLDSKRYR